MGSLEKRGKYYYGRWQTVVNGGRTNVRRSLGIKRKPVAQEAMQKIDELIEAGAVDPLAEGFNPVNILAQLEGNSDKQIYTMRKAADYFYRKKAHLSERTVSSDRGQGKASKRGAYERSIEQFLEVNELHDTAPKLVQQFHFEAIIFKPGIKAATRWYYFRQLRAFWNKLLDWNIVDTNHLAAIKNDMPDRKHNTRPKMLSPAEFDDLFNAFDEDLRRKRKRPDWSESMLQHWFKPLMAVYYYCGLRRSEAAYDSDLVYSGLKGENLQYHKGKLALIYLPPTKGYKERMIPISSECRALLRPYLFLRGPLKRNDYVFIYLGGSRKGWPVTGARAYRQFKEYAKLAGLPKARTLHGMRHERITTWLEQGYNASEAQYMAGHSSIKTTQQYTHLKGMNLLKKQRRIDGG